METENPVGINMKLEDILERMILFSSFIQIIIEKIDGGLKQRMIS